MTSSQPAEPDAPQVVAAPEPPLTPSPELTPPEPPQAEVESPVELTSTTVDLAGVDLSDMLSIGQRIETPAADIYLNAGDPGLILIDTTLRLRDRMRRVEPLPLTMFLKAVPREVAAIISSFASDKEIPNE